MTQTNAPLSGFNRALRQGLGRAMIILAGAPDNEQFHRALLDTCLTDLTYDPQCEADRIDYLYNLISVTGKHEFYKAELFRRLSTPMAESDTIQIFGILCRLIISGQNDDHLALRQFLIKIKDESYAHCCFKQYVRLNGVDGFLFCIAHLRQILVNENSGWVFKSFLEAIETNSGNTARHEALEKVRASWPQFDDLLQRIGGEEIIDDSKSKAELTSYTTLKSALDPKRAFPRAWIDIAPVGEIVEAANDLLIEQDDFKIWHYLKIFKWRDFPLPPAALFHFIQSENKRISRSAIIALRRLSHPDIRALALQTIAEGAKPARAIDLLCSNFQPGDLDAVAASIDGLCLDDGAWHEMGMATLELFDWATIPPTEGRPFLLRLYEETPCSLCRQHIVEALVAADQVPSWLANEARFDADPQTASLFKPTAA